MAASHFLFLRIEALKNISQNTSFQEGQLLLVNKPLTWTSFDVVNKLRYTIRKSGFECKKIGHAGTLDPLAGGLLLICSGKYTKRINELMGLDKLYSGKFILGKSTPSYDLETEVDAEYSVDHITEIEMENCKEKFIGEIEQIPPMYSAIKKDGVALYKHARKGKKVEVKSRSVVVNRYELDYSNFPEVKFEIDCSKGTYIRSLAHDFGQCLNNGAVLSELYRNSIGSYLARDAWELNKLVEEIQAFE